ncbi:D-aspartate ligase [Oceanobacillus limi]|uniref:D-aspartate ligase n=1 Tax=Oceanobacillus limi TaxID=930131 RepID=A0A1I0DKE8_9BACI|nr:ATP-grasp domain-containing protein [Oceanobacillus limi]SET32964.1 D-aspartate ligase [Oceanobacillus limi]
MKQDQQIKSQSFVPVIMGADIGAYSIARTFHEAYQVKSISISRGLIGPINHSVLLQNVIEKKMDQDEDLLQCLQRIEQTYPNLPKMLLGSDDWHIEMIVDVKKQLGEGWITPYTDRNVLDRVIDKSRFYQLCEELNVDYPKFITVRGDSPEKIELPFDFPVVIKPASRAPYEEVDFVGKKKVFTADNRDEFDRIISLLRNADYRDSIIIQEFVPGDDTSMHILTLYTAQDGKTKLASFGQTLLEDHTPGGIGNPVSILSLQNEKVIKQAIRLVESIGYVGYSNFDLKFDERDGKYKFFELNPRLGRSNYYVTAEGHNTATYYVKDYLQKEKLEYETATNHSLYSIVPKRLLLKYIKQKDIRTQVKKLYRSNKVKNPMNYFPVDKSLKRLFYVFASKMNFYKKFKNYPPM